MEEQTMEWIKQIVIWSPIPITIILYMIHKLMRKSRWYAIHFVSEYTTVFYIIATAIVCKMIFNISIIGYIILFILILLAIIIFRQWRQETEVLLSRALRFVLRMNFLLFSILYLLLISFYIYLQYFRS